MPETLADIVEQMRGLAADIESGNAVVGQTVWRNYANRIEAASKREAVGNMAAMREALEKVLEILNREWDAHRETSAMWEMQEICTAALAAPPRQCDAGTPEEQYQRYDKFCCSHFRITDDGDDDCSKCPFTQCLCKFAWAQMPYEEGGEK